MRSRVPLSLGALALGLLTAAGPSDGGLPPPLVPTGLRCEYRTDPVGVDSPNPGLTWVPSGEGRGRRQTAYRIVVSSGGLDRAEGEGTVWDTGRVDSSETAHVPYGGPPLTPDTVYRWKVRIWDENGSPSPWSPPASWTTGLLDTDGWEGRWIAGATRAHAPEDGAGPPPAYLRREFTVGKPVRRATVFATALGLFELSINGARVGEDLFTPGWSSYGSRTHYMAYDVTSLLRRGKNALGVILADGWYAGNVGFAPPGDPAWKGRGLYGDTPALLVQMNLHHEDGSVSTVFTDGSWKGSTGPILSSDILMGESYDARLEVPGWDGPGFDDSRWSRVRLPEVNPGLLQAYPAPPVRAVREVRPVKVTAAGPGTYLFDMGQNFAGRVRLKVEGNPGDTVILRHGEALQPDGTLMTRNLRRASASDRYTLRGGGPEVFEPRFTYHGFRYVEARGLPSPPGPGTVTGIVIHSDLPVTGSFTSSSGLLNSLFRAITWSARSNFVDIPTDCPQRDERMGWAGDIQLFSATAAYNMEVAPFLSRWLDALSDEQLPDGAYPDYAPAPFRFREPSPGWGDAGIVVPHTLYRMYGDRRILASRYPSMRRFMDRLVERASGSLPPAPDSMWGDWKAVDTDTPDDLVAAAYFAYDARLMADIALALERDEEARRYALIAERAAEEFGRRFVTGAGGVEGDTQTAYAMALDMGLLDPAGAGLAARKLGARLEEDGWRLTTGYLGTRHLLPALQRGGRPEAAVGLLLNEGFPSWGFMLNNGATTLWESWDALTAGGTMPDPVNTSLNHTALGSAGQWLFSGLAGIRPLEPGFSSILIKPVVLPSALQGVEARYGSIRGTIESRWKVAGKRLFLSVTIPPNCRGRIHLPSDGTVPVLEGGLPLQTAPGVQEFPANGEEIIVEVGSGEYAFESRLPDRLRRITVPMERDVRPGLPDGEVPWR